MPDDLDNAQRIEDLQRSVALEGMRRTVADLRREGREDCEDCEGRIPEGRRQAVRGATRCTRCQGIFDNDNQAKR